MGFNAWCCTMPIFMRKLCVYIYIYIYICVADLSAWRAQTKYIFIFVFFFHGILDTWLMYTYVIVNANEYVNRLNSTHDPRCLKFELFPGFQTLLFCWLREAPLFRDPLAGLMGAWWSRALPLRSNHPNWQVVKIHFKTFGSVQAVFPPHATADSVKKLLIEFHTHTHTRIPSRVLKIHFPMLFSWQQHFSPWKSWTLPTKASQLRHLPGMGCGALWSCRSFAWPCQPGDASVVPIWMSGL